MGIEWGQNSKRCGQEQSINPECISNLSKGTLVKKRIYSKWTFSLLAFHFFFEFFAIYTHFGLDFSKKRNKSEENIVIQHFNVDFKLNWLNFERFSSISFVHFIHIIQSDSVQMFQNSVNIWNKVNNKSGSNDFKIQKKANKFTKISRLSVEVRKVRI